jgi:hypothetical protein
VYTMQDEHKANYVCNDLQQQRLHHLPPTC